MSFQKSISTKNNYIPNNTYLLMHNNNFNDSLKLMFNISQEIIFFV